MPLPIISNYYDILARKSYKRSTLYDVICSFSINAIIPYTYYFKKEVKYRITKNSSYYAEYVRYRRSYNSVLVASSYISSFPLLIFR